MEEDKSRQTKDDSRKTMGLSLSDADDYHVNGQEPQAARRESSAVKSPKRGGRLVPFILGVLVCAAVVFTATEILGLGRFVSKERYDYYRDLDANYGKYYEIMKFIEEDPLAKKDVGEISDDELKEIVSSTGDPYAQYYTASEFTEFMKRYAGEYVGIGIIVSETDEGVLVMGVYKDSPAADAGMEPGDVIAKIDGKAARDVDDAVDRLSGEAGTPVEVTVKRGDEYIDMKMNRAKIDEPSVDYYRLESDPDIGYIWIASFITGTDRDFKAAVKDLKSQGCTSFIIDLRNNGGGLTDVSIDIADYLLPACRIMSEVSKSGAETVYTSKPSSAGIDYVVLVNGNTASASEILAAAIQDNNGGTIIGSKTYGKGVTQNTHRFDDGSAIKYTATEYFRPNGETVDGVGITPDIEAEGSEALDTAIEELEK